MAAWLDGQRGREAALVPLPRRVAPLVEHRAQGVEDLAARAQRLAEVGGAHGHHHELLEVGRVERVAAAVEDVEHGHGQRMRTRPAQVAVERQAVGLGGRMGAGE